MIDRNALERALLVGVVRQQRWNLFILSDITEDKFTYANRPIYRYIKDYVVLNKYPELPLLAYEFKISDEEMSEYVQIDDLQSMCEALNKEHLRDSLQQGMVKLNEYSQEIQDDPSKYIERLGNTYDTLKRLNYTDKSIGLFDEIEKVLTIDPSNVISTGFKELDDILVGWRRGEELVIFSARPGQGKSWMGLKFAFAAALQGERVGIYSGEMSVPQLQERIICCAKQSYTDTSEQAIQFIKSRNIDNIRVLTQKQLRRRANINDLEEMIVRDKLTMLVVDQLSLMEDCTSKVGTPLRQQYANITLDLFDLSIRYNLPCLLLVQTNRQGALQQNGPSLENLAESDAIGQNATRVITMRNEGGIMTLQLVKNRYGSSDLIQRYEVDYGINKYKPVQEYVPEIESIKKAKAKAIFMNKQVNKF